MAGPTTAEETSRRCRAAVGYSLLEHKDIEAELNALKLKPAKFHRVIARKDPHFATYDERQEIARICKVPGRFMEEGFPPDERERIELLERAVSELRTTQGLPPLPGALGHYDPGSEREDEHRKQPPNEGEADAHGGDE